MNDAIEWLETGFESTLRELHEEANRLEEDGYEDTFASPDEVHTPYTSRFRPVGYVRRGSVFFSIKPDNEIGIFINRQ